MLARRHLHLLIALLLPLMVLRGMLPAGYMPVAKGGAFVLALCSDGLQQPSGHGDRGRQLPGSNGDCLFAHAAASAPPPALAIFPVRGIIESSLTATPTAQQRASLIPRAQSPRGPPAYS